MFMLHRNDILIRTSTVSLHIPIAILSSVSLGLAKQPKGRLHIPVRVSYNPWPVRQCLNSKSSYACAVHRCGMCLREKRKYIAQQIIAKVNVSTAHSRYSTTTSPPAAQVHQRGIMFSLSCSTALIFAGLPFSFSNPVFPKSFSHALTSLKLTSTSPSTSASSSSSTAKVDSRRRLGASFARRARSAFMGLPSGVGAVECAGELSSCTVVSPA